MPAKYSSNCRQSARNPLHPE